jgi:ATP-dependent RNA helicase RhlE
VQRDPFFDRPYEPSAAPDTPAPAWEPAVKRVARSISANIKTRVRVPALFKAD